MLIPALAIFSILWAWAFWFMIFYPEKWNVFVEWEHKKLKPWGLSSEWVKQAEKSGWVKIVVGVTTIIGLLCLILSLKNF